MKDTFLIVDGNSLLYRAFHALPLMDSQGIYTNAVYGFLTMVLKAVQEESVTHLAVCFDEHAPTFRHTVYPDYKAGRAPTPPELIQQMDTIRTLLTDMGVRWYALAGWEADDLMGTLARLGAEAGVQPLLLTGDRDAMQLVDDTTQLMLTRKGISEVIRFTPQLMYDEYGFYPTQVTDWKGLSGDSSDNIPGIPGVGDKTAVKLLQQYGSLQTILANADMVKGKLGEKLRTYADLARQCRELATIRRDAPITWSLSSVAVPDWHAAVPALQKLQLNSIIRRITGDTAAAAAPAEAAAQVQAETVSFADADVIDTPDALRIWLEALPETALPVALHIGESEITAAAGDGRWCTASLFGDLLSPGMEPCELLRAAVGHLCAHEVMVHDGKALLHLLERYDLPLPERFAWDASLGAYLLNPGEKSYSMPLLAPGQPQNACTLYNLCLQQQSAVEAAGMTELMRTVELPLLHVLQRMETIGCRIDTGLLNRLSDQYVTEIEAARQAVYAACGVAPFNLNSTVQLGEVLFEKLMLPHGKKTSRGYSTSAEVLQSLDDIAPQVIRPLLRYRQLTKLQSTYIEALPRQADKAGRVHTHFDQTGTATGRLSSAEPNLQNIPVRTPEGRQIRQAFLPREGWVLLDADYSQIELRLMAHFSGDAAMVDAFRKGEDVHTRTAGEIFDVPADQVTPELRSRAKAVNFGIIYGISGFGLAKNTGVSQKEAGNFIKQYFEKYPGVKRFMEDCTRDGERNGYAATMMGRRRWLPQLKSSKAMVREFGKRAAMNTPVQGTAADIIKLAMVRVDEALRSAGLQARLILQVHDELMIECPPEEAETVSELLRQAMEGVISLSVPLLAEVHRGANWAEAK